MGGGGARTQTEQTMGMHEKRAGRFPSFIINHLILNEKLHKGVSFIVYRPLWTLQNEPFLVTVFTGD